MPTPRQRRRGASNIPLDLRLFFFILFALLIYYNANLIHLLEQDRSKEEEQQWLKIENVHVSQRSNKNDGQNSQRRWERTINNNPSEGIDPVYLELLEEAERRSNVDFHTSHKKGQKGIVIGPIGFSTAKAGDKDPILRRKYKRVFSGYLPTALRNAKRIRTIMAMGDERGGSEFDRDDIKVALITEARVVEMLQTCSSSTTTSVGDGKSQQQRRPDVITNELCHLWANGTLFDDIIVSKEPPNYINISHGGEYASPRFWMMKSSGYLLAPYNTTIFLDSDAYTCPGFGGLFSIATPRDPTNSNRFHNKLFQFSWLKPVDVAANVDPFISSNRYQDWTPGDGGILSDFKDFAEPNTGTVLFHFHQRAAHTFAHFVPLVAEYMYTKLASPEKPITHDQVPFRVALYLFKRLVPEFHDVQIPMHTSCRAYPGRDYSAIDAIRNGMVPMIDGKMCSECSCSPCLVFHGHGFELNINGTNGWD